jgi:putative transposase
MPRTQRVDVGTIVYHVINRANARMQIFNTNEDYQLFEDVLTEAKEEIPSMRILSYCIMPNHWHLVLYPVNDGDLQKFMGWLTLTHTRRWHVAHRTIGSGHLYQGRYKSFPAQSNEYFIQLCKYVERNALRAKLVKRAENWHWSSLWRRERGALEQKKLLSKWPVEMTDDYIVYVNEPDKDDELEELRYSVKRGKPYGKELWSNRMIDRFNLESTIRDPWRPTKKRP